MSGQCNHKWVDMEDGSLDKFCVRCSKKAKQAVMDMPLAQVATASITQPILKETMTLRSKIGNYG